GRPNRPVPDRAESFINFEQLKQQSGKGAGLLGRLCLKFALNQRFPRNQVSNAEKTALTAGFSVNRESCRNIYCDSPLIIT
ncbi:MAG: hypothetical protein II930_03640, partial [Lachnospiraceae bacterium]|nr:hypothetical protein [Lachnospiraceae bacterium]